MYDFKPSVFKEEVLGLSDFLQKTVPSDAKQPVRQEGATCTGYFSRPGIMSLFKNFDLYSYYKVSDLMDSSDATETGYAARRWRLMVYPSQGRPQAVPDVTSISLNYLEGVMSPGEVSSMWRQSLLRCAVDIQLLKPSGKVSVDVQSSAQLQAPNSMRRLWTPNSFSGSINEVNEKLARHGEHYYTAATPADVYEFASTDPALKAVFDAMKGLMVSGSGPLNEHMQETARKISQ